MVVLEQSGSKSASKSSESGGLTGSNPYFSSPYLQPLPSDSEMDSKVSPLAMLTRACNKIESDMLNSSTNPQQVAKSKNNNISPRPRSSDNNKPSPSPSGNRKCSPPLRSSGSTNSKHSACSPSGSGVKPSSPSQEKASPKTSSAPLASTSSAQALASSSAMSNYTMAAMAAAAAAAGFPPVLPPNSVSPYASLSAPPGLNKGSSNPCTDPLCRDPSCPSVILRQSQYANLMAASRNPFMFPPTAAAAAAGLGALPGLAGMGLPPTVGSDPNPYVCNWVYSGEFCGKKFPSSEDLMIHLRTHTSSSSTATSTSPSMAAKTSKPSPRPSPPADPSLAALQVAQAHAAALYSPSQPASALAALQAQAARVAAGSVPTPSTAAATPSPEMAMAYAAAAARYHPYARPGAPPSSLGSGILPPPPGMVPGAPSLPPHLSAAAGLSPYLSSPFGLPLL